jgi:cation diffusion facilitator family transporter
MLTKFEQCKGSVEYASWVDFWATLGQALFRGLIGWFSGSLGLSALGIYAIGDALGKGITLISIKVAKRPPSKSFPFGYGKILFVSSVVIGLSLIASGLYMGWTSFSHFEGVDAIPSPLSILGTLLSSIASIWLFRYLSCVGEKHNNLAILASAQENKGDAFTSAMVLLGILLATIGIPEADHYAAFLVSLAIIWMGLMVSWEALKGLLDIALPEDVLSDIARTARLTSGVEQVELIRGRNLGERWEIYLHIAVHENLSVKESNEIILQLKQRIHTQFSEIQHIWVVTQPYTQSEEGDYWSEQLFSFAKINNNSDSEENPHD